MWVWNFTASAPASAIASTKACARPRLPSCDSATSPMTRQRPEPRPAIAGCGFMLRVPGAERLFGHGLQPRHHFPGNLARHLGALVEPLRRAIGVLAPNRL